MRVSFLIDGFNLYGSIVDLKRKENVDVKWLNIYSLLSSYMSSYGKGATVSSIHYFTALQHYATKFDASDPGHHDPGKVSRHRDYIKCLECTGVTVSYGRFKRKRIHCNNCRSKIVKWEEKETDVSIGVKLLDVAVGNQADIIILVTGDTDLVPAVKICQKHFPHLPIGFCFPYRRKNEELAKLATTSNITMKKAQYLKHQFTDPFILPNGTSINKPARW